MKRLLRLTSVVSVILLLSACGQHAPQLRIDQLAPQTEAEQVWAKYRANAERRSAEVPFSLSTSFRFKTPDSSNRASLRIWGNGTSPVRIDILGPFGSVVASLRISDSRSVIYEPDSKRAVYSDSGQELLVRMGLPVSVSVQDIVALLRGNFADLFPKTYDTAYVEGTTNIAYTFSASPENKKSSQKLTEGILVLNKQGLPIVWEQKGKAMSISFEKYDHGLPDKISVIAGTERSALFLIKERSNPVVPFESQALELVLPPDTKLESMRPMS
jgi:outer membrane biogenesis lipoprotein LolB